MNKFSQFNIKTPEKGFEGDKIKMSKILNREIVIHDFKIENTKIEEFRKKGSQVYLHLQISVNNTMYIVFTSGSALIETIQKVPRDKFPFTATIIEDNSKYLFS